MFHAYIKNVIDWIGIDFLIEQLPEEQKPKNFDYNSTLSQVVLFVMCIIFWPYLLISMFKRNDTSNTNFIHTFNEENFLLRLEEMKTKYPEISYAESKLDGGKIVILNYNSIPEDDTGEIMDKAVRFLTENCLYNEFIEKQLDNPWVRILIFEYNKINFK